MNPFKKLLDERARQTPVGTWVMSASPIVVEAVGCAGFDWGVLDMEHTPLDLMDLVHMLQAVGNTAMLPVVRVPWNDTVLVKRVLDAGAATLLFPFIQNGEEAARAVAAARYPPEGVRGMAGMSRSSRFGTTPDHFRTANGRVCTLLQLETREAMARLEEIAAVPGVDALFVGPGDLSGTMGHVGQLTHPEVMALMADAARRANALGKPIGTVGGNPETVAQYRAMGYDYVAVASDLGLLMRAAQAAAQALRAIDAPVAAPADAAAAAPAPAAPRHEGY
ncbi:MAG: 2-dehydro-3-deoxyglucarate aldolase [Leptothrix sp. (in: Bacteria)]|nr:2-dehydro-3-deoxyglucarate aldolase [Leptothrix sp. (in: b-proteobacteria)]